jgi:hypothetical protein
MKKILFSFVVLLAFLLSSCTDPTENPNGNFDISAFAKNGSLAVTNNMSQIVYLFVVEQEYAVHINWAPSYGEPNVSAYNSILIDYSKISNGKTTPVQSGDTAIIYYWTKSGNNPVIKNIVIKL